MTVTIKDVARRANVSIKTVSRVINSEAYVREETRTRVTEAINELGYVANVSAQRLASGRSYAIGLICYNASWHYITHVLQGVLQTGRAAGYNTILQPLDSGPSHHSQEILKLVSQRSVDGIIFTPPADNSVALLEELEAAGVPFLRLSPTNRERPWPYVTTTDRQGAFDMTAYLVSLGHQRIGYIKGPSIQKAAHDRFEGFQAALVAAGIKPDPALVVQGDDHFNSGYACARRLLQLNPRPTAIFANNDEMAASILAAAHQLELAIPEQLSVAGFDDIPLARQVWPALTTIRQPIYELAELATNLLIQILAGETIPLRQELPTALVIRQSTGRVQVK